MRTRTKAALWLVLIFLAGAALGGSATFLTLRRVGAPQEEASRPAERQPPAPDRVANRINERAQLKLSASQLERLTQILTESRERVHDVTAESGRRIDSIREATNEEIRLLLDEEQRVKFDRHLQEWLERRARREASGSNGRPPR